MTNILKTSAVALAAVLSLAGAARAEGVRVAVTGRAPDAVRADVLKAAHAVCNDAVSRDFAGVYGPVDECVSATVQAAYRDLRHQSRAFAVASAR